MVTHNNIYIPGESFPHWVWFVIEFFIVLAVAAGIAAQITPSFQDMVVSQTWVCEQESHETKCHLSEERVPNQVILTWIFWGIVVAVFLGWYIIIRGIILKKPILESRRF